MSTTLGDDNGQDMILGLTDREIRLVLQWRSKGAFFPDEERVLRKFRQAVDTESPLELSRLQVQVVHGWAEERLGGHYGGGEVANPDEAGILRKVRQALGYDA